MRLWRLMAACLLAAGFVTTSHAGDSLSGLREEVRDSSPAPPAEPKQPREKQSWEECDHDDDDDDTQDAFASAIILGVGVVATSPFWGPNVLLETENIGAAYFAPYPYEASDGYLVFDRELNLGPPAGAYSWTTKLRAEYGDDFDSLTRWGGHVLVEHSCRLGLDSETNYWQEGLAGGAHDNLWTGDLNLVFRFAQSERVQFRSGAGVNWLADDVGTELGFNFTYGADFYFAKPWVLSTELDAGWLGDAPMVHLRSTIGVQWRQAEIYTGYDYREIGSTQLDGFVAGVRVMF